MTLLRTPISFTCSWIKAKTKKPWPNWIALTPGNPQWIGKPSVESLKLRADIQIGQKKWKDAIATLQQAASLAPNDAQLHGGLGRTYLQVRDFPNAEKELKAAIQLDAKKVDYWKDLSTTYYLSKNYPATLAVLDRVDKFETPGAGSWFIRALCYDSLNQPKPALEAYQKFMELDQKKNPDQF